MENIKLSIAISDNPRLQPITRKQISPQGIDLDCCILRPSEIFRRQLRYSEFDISEMSMSSHLMLHSRGIDTWIGLPVFTSRRFAYTDLLVREDTGITEPAQLAGRRVGVGVHGYQHTAALWTRGILQHEFGLDPKSVYWFMEPSDEIDDGDVRPPHGIDLQYLPVGATMSAMIRNNQLDATILVEHDKAQLDVEGIDTRPLFNRREESARYFRKTGIFPIHHCVVVRKNIVQRYPWAMLNLYSAFVAAKQLAMNETLAGGTSPSAIDSTGLDPSVETGLMDHKAYELPSADLYQYGVAANRYTLEAIVSYSVEQGLSSHELELSDIFYPPTLTM